MKPFISFGLRTGILSGSWSLLSFTFAGWLNAAVFHSRVPATQIRSYSGLFSIIILLLGIYFGMKQARSRNSNTLTYGHAVKTGILISCITAVIVAVFGLLYCTVINPGYTDFMVHDVQQSLLAAGRSPREIGQGMEAARKEFSTGAQVGEALAGQAIIGTIASLLIGLFMRTKNK